VGRDNVRLKKLHEAETPPLRCRITLGQAIPKGKNMDLIVQKAVEIGAAEIAPLISERTIVDLDPKEAEQKQGKWQQVAIEAAKQCGQNWVPKVQVPRKLRDFFGNAAVEAAVPGISMGPQPSGRAASTGATLQLIGSAPVRCATSEENHYGLCEQSRQPPCQRPHAYRPGRRFHPRGARPRQDSRLPTDHPRPNHFEGRDGRPLLPECTLLRIVLINLGGAAAPPAREDFRSSPAAAGTKVGCILRTVLIAVRFQKKARINSESLFFSLL